MRSIEMDVAIAIAVVGRGFLVQWCVDGQTFHAHAHNRDVLAKVVHEAAKRVRHERATDTPWPDVEGKPSTLEPQA